MNVRLFKTTAGEFVIGTLVGVDTGTGAVDTSDSLLQSVKLVNTHSFVLETPLMLGRSPQGGLGLGTAVPWVGPDSDCRVTYPSSAISFEVDHTQERLHAGMIADYKQATSKIQLVQCGVGNRNVGVGSPFGRGMPT